MTPLLPGPRSRSALIGVVVAAVAVAGFLLLRQDHAALGARIDAAPPARLGGRAADGLAESRREIRAALVRTATDIAGYALDWHLRPAAFGGGDGRWAGLSFQVLGYPADADGRYRTTDGAFALRPEAEGVSVVATNDRLGVEATVALQRAGGDLELVVDGRPVEGLPHPAARGPARDPAAAHAQLRREAEQLADYVTMVLEAEPPESPVQQQRARRLVSLAALGVETGPDGAFHTPYGALRLTWTSPVRGRVEGTDAHGRGVSVDLRVPPPPALRPAAASGGSPPSPGRHESGVVPEAIPEAFRPLPPGQRVDQGAGPPR